MLRGVESVDANGPIVLTSLKASVPRIPDIHSRSDVGTEFLREFILVEERSTSFFESVDAADSDAASASYSQAFQRSATSGKAVSYC